MTVTFRHTCGVCGEQVRFREKGYQHLSRRIDHPVSGVQAQQQDPQKETAR